ncbi:MAG: hypothetical protein WC273_01010 [Dehalococcoidia bacterium]
MNDSSNPARRRRREAALVIGVGIASALVVLAAIAAADLRTGDRFDLVRWERMTLPGKWLYLLGAPLRRDPAPDVAIARYFAAPAGSEERRRLEGAVEASVTGRIDAALRTRGLRGAVPLPGTVFPPVNIELTQPPRVLVESPRAIIQRSGTELLRPDLTTDAAVAIERVTEAAHPDRSALVVASGGVAAYPAIVDNSDTYADTLSTAAHEWTHHYLAFYPLGLHYFDSRDATTINETVADIVGAEIGADVLARWGDPTRPAGAPAPSAPRAAPRGPDVNATLRDLRREVDALLAAGKVAEAEARMETVRQQLWDGGYRIRRLNQAYFAWYGSYAARPDAIDPLGGQLRELRTRAGSLAAFLAVVRDTTSRAEVAGALESLRAR